MVVHTKSDVFVIGGGPAGLAAAIAARQKGLSVTLADGATPPIDKPCGEGMMPETLAALRELGVQLSPDCGFRFCGIRFVHGASHAAADFPVGQGIGIRRPLLHELLLHHAEKCGVQFLWKTPVTGISSDGVQLPGVTFRSRWIIGADGGASRVRRWSALDVTRQRHQRSATRRHYRIQPWSPYMEIYWGHRSQAYVTPISPEEVCIVVMAEHTEDASFDHALSSMPELRDRLAGAPLGSRERGTITAMHSLHRIARGNVALAGDASGGVDAITGEGLRLAFRQALALAAAMRSGDLRHYQRLHRQLARRPIWMGKLMLQLGRHASLRDRALRIFSQNPQLFARFLAVHVGHAPPSNLVAAGAELGWQLFTA